MTETKAAKATEKTTSKKFVEALSILLIIGVAVGLVAGLGNAYNFFALYNDNWWAGVIVTGLVGFIAWLGIRWSTKTSKADKDMKAMAIGLGTVFVVALVGFGALAVLSQLSLFKLDEFGYGALCVAILIIASIIVGLTVHFHRRIYIWLKA